MVLDDLSNTFAGEGLFPETGLDLVEYFEVTSFALVQDYGSAKPPLLMDRTAILTVLQRKIS